MAEKSYTSATSDTPLLGDTIGENLTGRSPATPTALALVDRRPAPDLRGAERGGRRTRLGLLRRASTRATGSGIWAPNCAEWTLTQYATAKIGAILVNINPAYRTSELEFVLNQSGCKLLVAAQRLKTSDYAAMIAEVRPRCPALSRSCCSTPPAWHALLAPESTPTPQRGTRRDRALRRRADQHPVHLGHDGLPEGRDAVATTTY